MKVTLTQPLGTRQVGTKRHCGRRPTSRVTKESDQCPDKHSKRDNN